MSFRLIERRRQRLEHQAEHERTELFDDLPILMVDTTDSLVALTAELREMPENLVLGVDTEYKHSFMHLSDQYVACTFKPLALLIFQNCAHPDLGRSAGVARGRSHARGASGHRTAVDGVLRRALLHRRAEKR